MSHAIANSPAHDTGFGRGAAIMGYAALAYLVGVVGLGLLILEATGLVPLGPFRMTENAGMAAVIDVGLLLMFGLQHSVMARPAFKQRMYRLMPKALERSTYVWTSGVAMGAIVLLWQPIDGMIWQTSGALSWLLLAGGVFGWAYLFAATFAINHFDLFGLRQGWLAARGEAYTNVAFREHWMYRYSRHPIMLGVLIGIWSMPTMTATQAFFSAGLTLYMAIGVYFEERDLIRQWGQSYVEYKRRVGALFSIR